LGRDGKSYQYGESGALVGDNIEPSSEIARQTLCPGQIAINSVKNVVGLNA
jgi:hypothetical protein